MFLEIETQKFLSHFPYKKLNILIKLAVLAQKAALAKS